MFPRELFPGGPQHRDHINALVVHCEQGMSRSPAVAAAVAQAFGYDTTRYDRDYQPNAYVRQLVCGALKSAQLPGVTYTETGDGPAIQIGPHE